MPSSLWMASSQMTFKITRGIFFPFERFDCQRPANPVEHLRGYPPRPGGDSDLLSERESEHYKGGRGGFWKLAAPQQPPPNLLPLSWPHAAAQVWCQCWAQELWERSHNHKARLFWFWFTWRKLEGRVDFHLWGWFWKELAEPLRAIQFPEQTKMGIGDAGVGPDVWLIPRNSEPLNPILPLKWATGLCKHFLPAFSSLWDEWWNVIKESQMLKVLPSYAMKNFGGRDIRRTAKPDV